MVKEKSDILELESLVDSMSKVLVLHNDDYNTFDYIIETLMEVCGHELIQAEQIAMIAHYKGKCSAKKGDYDFLNPIKTEMIRRGIIVTLE